MRVFVPAIVSRRPLNLLKLLVLSCLLVVQFADANSAYSGSWYNPQRDGEGFHVEILDNNQVMVIWFTYPGPTDDPTAEQGWILGNGTISDNTITMSEVSRFVGPKFGPDYNKDDLVFIPWGNLIIEFSGNNNATVQYDGLDGKGTTEVIRVTSVAEQENATRIPVGFSGAWYDPNTNGQGWFVEILSDELALAYFFTYDTLGNQAWNVGVGYIDGNRIVIPNSESGKGTFFGEGFIQNDVERKPFIDVVLEYEDCKSGNAKYRTIDGEHSDSLPIVRLATLAGNECKVLQLKPTEGGSIQSASGELDCIEARTCLIDVEGKSSLEETFTAIPRTGYEFKGWQEGSQAQCVGELEACSPDPSNFAGDATLAPIFEPEGTTYYPPEGSLRVCSYIEPNFSQSLQCEMKLFEDYGYGKLTEFTVNSKRFFLDYESRKKELEVLDDSVREAICDIDDVSGAIDFSDYIPIPPPNPEQDSVPPWPGVHQPLVLGRVQFTLLENRTAGEMVRRILLEWAKHEVDLNWDLSRDFGNEAHYQLGLTMIIYVMAWDAIRSEDFVSAEDRNIIDDYLHELMIFLAQMIEHEIGKVIENDFQCGTPCYWGNNEVFNHAWTQDLSLMAYGVLTGNDALYQRGIRRFFEVIDGLIRPDGSHFSESQRGGGALSYSIGSTDTLIRFAELAASQGHDLYSVEIDGVSLHTIMEYHVSVLEDETLMHPYSQSALEPSNSQFCEHNQVCMDNWNNLFHSEENPHGYRRENGWVEFDVYRKRFPDSPLVERYLSMFPDEIHTLSMEGPFLQVCEFRDFSN